MNNLNSHKKDDEVTLGQFELSDGIYRLSNSTMVGGRLDKAYIDPVRQVSLQKHPHVGNRFISQFFKRQNAQPNCATLNM